MKTFCANGVSTGSFAILASDKRRNRFAILLGVVVSCTVLGRMAPAWSATYTWSSTAATSNWSAAANWGGTVPGSGDVGRFAAASYTSQPSLTNTASIGGIWDTGAAAVTIGGSRALTLYGATIGSNPATGIELDAGAGGLTINAPLVVQNSQNWIDNSPSPFTINGNVSGGGSPTKLGTGLLTMTGSNNLTGNYNSLTVDGGTLQLANGSLTLTSSQAASGYGVECVGYSGTGAFVQSGGRNNPESVVLGFNAGATGSYTLASSGTIVTSYGECVGNSGTGSFTQTAGTNNAGGNLYAGYFAGSSGTYSLGGSGLLVSTSAYVGYSGAASFQQSGGTVSVSNLYLGYSPGATGSYTLSGSGLLLAGPYEAIGWNGTGSCTQSGGTNSANTLWVSGGTYNLNGPGLLAMYYEDAVYSGYITQSGGTNSAAGLSVGILSHSGAYNLNGVGLLSTSAVTVGASAPGCFTQSGGTNQVSLGLAVGYASGSGSYSLSGSGLVNSSNAMEEIGWSGTGTFTQSGGTNLVGGLIIAQSGNSWGAYNLNGGLLAISSRGLTHGIGASSGTANFNFGGGTLGATAPWSSSLNLNLTGSGGAATIDTTGGNVMLSGNLTGFGQLNKVGPGILSLSGTASALAMLTVDGGTLQLSGGSLSAANEYVGSSHNATLTQTGGTNAIANCLCLGLGPGSIGSYNLAGGLLVVPSIIQGAGSGEIIFSGGTLTGGTSNATVKVPIYLNRPRTTTATLAVDPDVIQAAPISGPGGITKTGPGTLMLTQANPYTGDTVIAEGVVELANAAAVKNTTVILEAPNVLQFGTGSAGTVSVGGLSGSGAMSLSDSNGNPIVLSVGGNNADTTYSGSIGGPGTLAKAGSGSLDLVGSSNWTGGLILDPGILAVGGDPALGSPTGIATWGGLHANIIFVANSTLQTRGSFALSPNRTIAIAAGTTATLDTQGNVPAIGCPISGPGGLATAGGGTVVLFGGNTYAAATTVAGGTLKLDFGQPGAPAANIINNAADNSALVLSGGTLVVQGNANASDSQQFNGLSVNAGCSAIVLAAGASNPLLLSLGSISRIPGGTIDFTLPSGAQSSANGVITTTANTSGILGGYATVAGTNWACSSGGNITAYAAYTTGNLGALTSNAALNVEPTGTQTPVTAADTFNSLNLTGSVGVTLSGAGSLTLISGGLLGNSSGSINGGTLKGAPGGDLIVITPHNLTITSTLADNGGATGLTKAGSAALVLLGNNCYSGTTEIGGGTLQVGNGGAGGTLGTGPVNDAAALVFNTGGTSSFSGGISGAGSLTKTGSGCIVLGGVNTYTGGTTIGQGVLQLASSAALLNTTAAINADNGLQFSPGIGVFCLGGLSGGHLLQATDTCGGGVALFVGGNGASTTFSGAIGGNGSLTKTGSGTLVLSGPASYGGGTLLAAGALQIGNGGGSGSLAGNVTNDATLVFDRSDNPTFSGTIGGSGSLTQAGAGVLTLSNSNGYSGGTTILSGAIALNHAGAAANSTVTVGVNNGLLFNTRGGAIAAFNVGGLAGSGSFALADGSHALTLNCGGNGSSTVYSGAMSGAGGMTKTGGGITTLCGGSKYAGVTTVAGGGLLLDFSQSAAPAANIVNNSGNSSSLVLSGGTLSLQGCASAANSQRFNGLSVNAGCAAIVLTANSNPLALSLGSINRSPGGTVDFTLPAGAPSATNGVTTSTPNNAAGILGAYATVNGADWACNSGGNITAYSSYTGGDLGSGTANSASNFSPSTLPSSLTTAVTINTLNLTQAYGVTMTGGGRLTLAGGGLIGNTFGVISGGTLEGSSGTAGNGELLVNTPQDLTIASVIADNGGPTALIKAGSATLVLAGSNTYHGATDILAGTLQIGNGTASGSLGAGAVLDSSALVFNLAAAATYSGAISGGGGLTQDGPGTLVLCGTNTYRGGTLVEGGELVLTNPAALADGSSLTVGGADNGVFDPTAFSAPRAGSIGGPLSPADASYELAVTDAAEMPAPEPGTLGLLVIAGATLLLRQHRRPRPT